MDFRTVGSLLVLVLLLGVCAARQDEVRLKVPGACVSFNCKANNNDDNHNFGGDRKQTGNRLVS